MMVFSQMHSLPLAIATMMVMGLFVKMSNGANYSVVPFINRRGLGAVAGIVGAEESGRRPGRPSLQDIQPDAIRRRF